MNNIDLTYAADRGRYFEVRIRMFVNERVRGPEFEVLTTLYPDCDEAHVAWAAFMDAHMCVLFEAYGSRVRTTFDSYDAAVEWAHALSLLALVHVGPEVGLSYQQLQTQYQEHAKAVLSGIKTGVHHAKS